MSSLPRTFLTPEQYLEIERAAEFRSEYFQGEMFAMSGGSLNHSLVIGNTIGNMWSKGRVRGCHTCNSDMRVHIPATGLYTYPDVVMICGEPQLQDGRRDTLLNSTL